MVQIQVDQRVRVLQDIPELGLLRGEVGMVCSKWFDPTIAYEVEFQRELPCCCVRALLMANQIRADAQIKK